MASIDLPTDLKKSLPWPEYVKSIALTLIVIGLSIRPSAVNSATIYISEYIRLYFILFSSALILYIAYKIKIDKFVLFPILIYSLFYFYIVLLGIDNLFVLENIYFLYFGALIPPVILFAYHVCRDQIAQLRSAKYIVFLSFLWAAFTYVTGGISNEIPPKFNFEALSLEGAQTDYTQGASFFYATAAICSGIILKASMENKYKILYSILMLFFIFLAFAGGSRGEIVIALLIIIFSTLPKNIFYRIMLTLFFFVLSLFMVSYILNFNEDYVVFSRFREIINGESYGQRDILFNQGLSLLNYNQGCFIHGCGAFYFQSFFNYPYGLYPHNLIIEIAISGGVLITIILIIGFWRGLLFTPIKNSYYYIFLFNFLVSMKSGDIFGSWVSIAFIFYTAALGFIVFYYGARYTSEMMDLNQSEKGWL